MAIPKLKDVVNKIKKKVTIGKGDERRALEALKKALSILRGRITTIGIVDFNKAPAAVSVGRTNTEFSNNNAIFTVDYEASDNDGNLDNVNLKLIDVTDGDALEDEVDVSVSGATATGSETLQVPEVDNNDHDFQIQLTVEDTFGATDSTSTGFTFTVDGGGGGGLS